mgnify:CR=1 FL=1
MAKAYKPLPHASELWELFDYKPLTGELVRRVGRGGSPSGTIAGTARRDGYVCIAVQNRKYLLHRLVWAWVTAGDPGTNEVDHRDRNRGNNRFCNLRLATEQQNKVNTAARAHNTLGVKGVEVLPSGKYRVRIVQDGRRVRLGSFPTLEEAGAAYAKAAVELHGDFACIQ